MLVCRFCMTQNDVDIDLFQSALYSKLVCLPVQIADNDILPKRICHQCETKVYNFYSFWRCVQDVEKELLSQIDSDKIILDSDDVMLSPDTQIVSNSVKTSSLSRSTMTLRSSVPNKSSASTINKATSSIQNNNNNNNNNSINISELTYKSDDVNAQMLNEEQEDIDYVLPMDINVEVCLEYSDSENPLSFPDESKSGIEKPFVQPKKGSDKIRIRRYVCMFCKKPNRSEATRQRHYRTEHVNENMFECERCSQLFKLEFNYRNHINRNVCVRKYECHVCKLQFVKMYKLRSHMAASHSTFLYGGVIN